MTEMLIFQTFFLLLCGHAMADFALQSEWIATNKNRHARKNLDTQKLYKAQIIWPYLMSAHSLIHGLMVFLITGKLLLGVAETVVHWIIDFAKCERWFGFHTDQFLHVLCKVIWVYLIISQTV